jgi:hypothetical protein
MDRACGRTIQITGLAFRIRIVGSPTELGIGCRQGVLRDVLRAFVQYLEIPVVDAPELLGNRIVQVVRATGDPERLLANQIAQEMDSREFFLCRIGQETGDLQRLVNQTAPAAQEGNPGDQPSDLATRVLGRGRRTDLRSTGFKQVQATAHRSNATAATQALAIARNRVLQPQHSNALLHRHGRRRSHDRLLAQDSRRNAE